MKTNYVLIISGQFQYGVASNFLQELAIELGRLNYEVLWFPLSAEQSHEQHLVHLYNLIANKNIKFIFGINGLGLDYVSCLDALNQLPCFSWLLDHPVHHYQRFAAHKTWLKLLCVDQSHVNWLTRLSFDAEPFLHATKVRSLAPRPATDVGILFPASYFDETAQISALHAAHPKLLELLMDPAIDSLPTLLSVLRFGEKDGVLEADANTLNFLRLADLFLRGRNRNQLVHDFAEAGIQLAIAGRGWNEVGASSHLILRSMTWQELKQLFSRSQFVLHDHPGFSAGLHERVLTSLAAGTAVLTRHNSFLEQQFSPADGVYGFRQASELLQLGLDEHNPEHIAQSEALLRHSWSCRANQLLQLVGKDHSDIAELVMG